MGGVTRESKKPAISPKRCKIGPRLLLRTNIKSYTRFRLVPKSRPWITLNGVSRDCPKFFQIPAIISGMGKATDFKFGRHIHGVHLNKSALKIVEKIRVGVSRDCPKFLKYPLLSQERVKLRTSNLAGTFMTSFSTKYH